MYNPASNFNPAIQVHKEIFIASGRQLSGNPKDELGRDLLLRSGQGACGGFDPRNVWGLFGLGAGA
jgi:hypothetical protein